MTSTPDIIKDRRAQGRIRVSFPVELRDISFAFKGSAVDLSPGGIRVKFAAAPPLVNTDLELTLRPDGEPPVRLKGRVMHGGRAEAGVAFAVGDPEIFEAALTLYETLLMRDPKLAIRLKQRPSMLQVSHKLWPLPLKEAQLSGPEHWVYGKLALSGTVIAEIQTSIGAEWPRLAYVPFALLERGLASVTEPQPMADEEPPPSKTTGSRPAVAVARKPMK
jgi:hypothetical protein